MPYKWSGRQSARGKEDRQRGKARRTLLSVQCLPLPLHETRFLLPPGFWCSASSTTLVSPLNNMGNAGSRSRMKRSKTFKSPKSAAREYAAVSTAASEDTHNSESSSTSAEKKVKVSAKKSYPSFFVVSLLNFLPHTHSSPALSCSLAVGHSRAV